MSQSEPLPAKFIEYLFMELHGRFGNAFFDKFRIGKLNGNGDDVGVENAKQVWAKRLAGMSKERLRNALDSNYDYAPSCDDFLANCVVKHVQQDYKALPVVRNEQVEQEGLEKINKLVEETMKDKTDYRAWAKRIISNPKNHPDISVRFAKEALGVVCNA